MCTLIGYFFEVRKTMISYLEEVCFFMMKTNKRSATPWDGRSFMKLVNFLSMRMLLKEI